MKARYAYKITGVLAAIVAATALSATAQDTTATDPSAAVPSQATVPGSVAPSTTPAPTVEAPNTTATPNPTAEPAVETPATPPANPDAAADSVAQTTPDATLPDTAPAVADASAPKAFMQQAFLANEFSAAAAEIALQKGSTQEVKDTAQSVLNDATKTRAGMVTAIQTSTSDMHFDQNWDEAYKQKLADLNTLEGAEFDAKYLELQGQVSHDSEGLYQSFAATASDEAAKTFASATLPTLTAQNDALESVSQGGQ
ncbi:hypothetical protein ABAC460_23745 [Asticcacaulis sp. AC460]|uniref:DUF4142 domain-containing protein n=1 Tax=Asticcacaulis sp. AC460 TaxID=1282360 RepID=UPI0003C3F5E2|nr:DUF4142 domain-containing protein [Asticcacaulis sp. AC460]ESQ85373.1 hypothetical protein ABAC460_23745 [Asticcacaulis sp. AC460]